MLCAAGVLLLGIASSVISCYDEVEARRESDVTFTAKTEEPLSTV